MAEDRPVHESLLDCLVYAPLGAAIVALEEVPRLAELGRERVDKQVAIARLIGRFAVAEGRRRFGPPQARHPRRDTPPDAAEPQADSRAVEEVETAALPSERASQASSNEGSEAALQSNTMESLEPPTIGTSRPGHDLPIPAYDTLAASQVVERLASLTPDELEAVRSHEAATRRRRTVLHRIAQLNAEQDGATA